MKLLKVYFDHIRMFKDGILDLDLFASDRVPTSEESVFELKQPIYSNNIVSIAGINATGKTTVLKLLELACRIVNGVPISSSEVSTSLLTLFDNNPRFRCLIWHENTSYLIDSQLILEEYGFPISFSEETISFINGNRLKKSDLESWKTLELLSTYLSSRSTIDKKITSLMAPDISISAAMIGDRIDNRIKIPIIRDEGFSLTEGFEGLDEILRVFDSEIEHLEVGDSGRAFLLTFKNCNPVPLSKQGLVEVLSSGTVRGLGLVQRSLSVLKNGGYLLVDEIENHLNHQLVNVILSLFDSKSTNPKGATLIFTTHYPQLLDYIHRKDNVFFLVRNKEGTSTIKYCDKVKRIENKKSEVFISNYIKGTAPKYNDVKALKVFIEKGVANV